MKEELIRSIGRLRSPQGYLYAGSPRFETLFGRDGLITAWQMLFHDVSIARATLAALAKHQGTRADTLSEEQPGKILHEFSHKPEEAATMGWKFPYYGSVDSTTLFIIVAGLYFRASRDRAFLRTLWPHLMRAMEWHLEYGDKDGDGFIEYERLNPRGLMHQGWKDSSQMSFLGLVPPVAIVEEQGYFYRACLEFAALSRTLGYGESLGKEMKARALGLKKRFNRAFWMREHQYYALGLNADKQQCESIASNAGHLIFTGILSKARQRAVVKRLFAPDMLTQFGIRTLSSYDPNFDPFSYHRGSVWPHDNWLIFEGLKANGFADAAQEVRHCMMRAYERFSGIPELFAVVGEGEQAHAEYIEKEESGHRANPIQAWAIAGLLNMISAD